MEANRDGPAPVALGELVVVVPAVLAALVSVGVGPGASERDEGKVAVVGQLAEPDRPGPRVQPYRNASAVGQPDLSVLDVAALDRKSVV